MAGSFTERLQLIVDATTTGAEGGLARLAGSAERVGDAAREAGETVGRAAQRVAEAREKEADAAGKVRVAEQRLQDLRDRGITSGSRYVAAEEQLNTARRRHHTSSRQLEGAIESQADAERRAVAATDDAADAADRQGASLDNLKGKIAGLIAGVSLADWARDSITGFVDGARASQAMATSMNATVEQAGAFLGLVGSVGLELDDLIEIQAEFATKTRDGLTQLGTELQHNNDGTVNWTETLVDTLGTLQGVTDATERNRLGFSMFGEEGYKQLSRLLNSGVDVRDALEQIGTPFTEDDVELARQYDAAMLEFDQASGELGRTLGRAVIPLVLGLVDAGQDLADIVGEIPGPILATGAAAVLLGIGMRRAAIEGTFMAGAVARASAATGVLTGRLAGATASTAAFAAATRGAAAAAGTSLLGAIGGPFGVALLAAGAAFWAASEGAEQLDKHAREAAQAMAEAEAAGEDPGTIRERAEALADEAGVWESLSASVRGAAAQREELSGWRRGLAETSQAFGFSSVGVTGLLAEESSEVRGFEEAIEQARKELGEFGAQQETTRQTTKTLNDLIAEGTTSGDEFAEAVQNAADAQADEARTTDLATAAIAAHNAVTRDAITTMLELYQAQLGQRSGWQDVLTALQDTATATEDGETAASEVEQAYIDLIGTVLDYGSASADAAVEAARAAGTVLDPLTEAQIRADATIGALRESLDAPNLTERARGEIQAMIDQLAEAQESGNIEAILSLTGGDETSGEIDAATEDRETTVHVESRGGPDVDRYLDGLAAAQRLAIVRVESRGGPAVKAYLGTLADARRLALIRVESRGGPDVDRYLDSIAAQDRLAIIRVETRGGPAVQQYLDDLAGAARVAGIALGGGLRGAPAAGTYGSSSRVGLGSVELDLKLTGTLDRGQVASAERGRAHVRDIRAYEQRNGTGWRRQP